MTHPLSLHEELDVRPKTGFRLPWDSLTWEIFADDQWIDFEEWQKLVAPKMEQLGIAFATPLEVGDEPVLMFRLRSGAAISAQAFLAGPEPVQFHSLIEADEFLAANPRYAGYTPVQDPATGWVSLQPPAPVSDLDQQREDRLRAEEERLWAQFEGQDDLTLFELQELDLAQKRLETAEKTLDLETKGQAFQQEFDREQALRDEAFRQGQFGLQQGQFGLQQRQFGLQQQELAAQQQPGSFEEHMTDLLASGQFDKAQRIFTFANQPTSQQRLDAALAIAQSPGDFAVLGALSRGETGLPGGFRAPGAGVQLPGQGRAVPLAGFLQEAAQGFFDGGLGGGAFPGFDQAITDAALPGFDQAITDAALLERAGGKITREALLDRGLTSAEARQVVRLRREQQATAGQQFARLRQEQQATAGPRSIADREREAHAAWLSLVDQLAELRANPEVEEGEPEDQALFALERQADAAHKTWLMLQKELGVQERNPETNTGQVTGGTTGGSTTTRQPGTRQRGGGQLAAAAAGNAGGFTQFGGFSPAVERAFRGETVKPETVSPQALGAPVFRSEQSIQNMFPFERRQFEAGVRLSGFPLEDFLEREQRLFPTAARLPTFRPLAAR